MGLIILTKLAGWAKAVPIWVWIVAIALAWGGWQRHRATAVAAEYQQAQAEASAQREAALAASIAETKRRLAKSQEVARDADSQALAARAAAARAIDSADRVRLRFATVEALSRAGDTPLAFAGTAASAPSLLLIDVFGQCVGRVRQLAEYADSARIAGTACESAYGSLTR
jgi:hypothetical protein